MSARALGATYTALWVATLAGAALAGVGVELARVDASGGAGLEPTLGTVVELVTHNALVALWPLALVAIGWPELVGARVLGDAVIGAQLVAHGVLVGTALGQHPELWRYLPHLPLEWLALALPAGTWLTARRSRPSARLSSTTMSGVPAVAVAALAALAGAAVVETYLVPVT